MTIRKLILGIRYLLCLALLEMLKYRGYFLTTVRPVRTYILI